MKEDITRLAIDRSLKLMDGVLAEMQRVMPYGPRRVQMTPAELKKNLRAARGETLLALMDVLGQDRVMEMLHNGVPTNR